MNQQFLFKNCSFVIVNESTRYFISFNWVFLILFLSLEVIKLLRRMSKACLNALLIKTVLLINISWVKLLKIMNQFPIQKNKKYNQCCKMCTMTFSIIYPYYDVHGYKLYKSLNIFHTNIRREKIIYYCFYRTM